MPKRPQKNTLDSYFSPKPKNLDKENTSSVTPTGNTSRPQTPLRSKGNQQTPTCDRENQQTPTCNRENQQTPSCDRENQQTPTRNRENQQTPSCDSENQQTPTCDRENQQTPSGKGEKKNMAPGFDKSEDFCWKDVKKEFEDPEGDHSHNFNLKFSGSEDITVISCDRPQTVLEAIKSKRVYRKNVQCGEDHIILQIGKASQGTAIATHFPCSCLKDNELITLSLQKGSAIVEDLKGKPYPAMVSRDDYSVIYIETQGGLHTKTKQLLRNSACKKFSKLCVYGTKDTTVEDAIRNDGRFCDSLVFFKLADTSKTKTYVYCDEKIGTHDGKTFRICLTKNAPEKAEKITHLKILAKPRVISVNTTLKKAQAKDSQENVDEIYEKLREQFPRLKEEMMKRFPDDTFEKTLKKVDFGKAQQSFSDVFRLEKLLKFGKSVCKLIVGTTVEGTAFVLCENYILTNAHLFHKIILSDNLSLDVEINALFNHESPNPRNSLFYFPVKTTIIDLDEDLDYAVLELEVSGQGGRKVPPGLLKHFCPMPKSGEACIIGHPGGQVKKIDPTCIIEKEKRQEEINKHLDSFQGIITLMSVSEIIKKQGIENIIMLDNVVSYQTYMYHGSSGSPVFNGECKVFGLHGSGFVYGFPRNAESVLEIAHPVLDIFKRLVTNLKDKGKNEPLVKIKEESEGNKWLEEILNAPEPMETD